MLPPLPRHSDWRYCFAHPSSRISLPRNGHRVGLRIDLFEACSAFTHVAACTLALPPYFVARLSEGFSHFVTSMSCSGCFRLERLPGGACTHWKAPPLHGAHPEEPVPLADLIRRLPGDEQSIGGIRRSPSDWTTLSSRISRNPGTTAYPRQDEPTPPTYWFRYWLSPSHTSGSCPCVPGACPWGPVHRGFTYTRPYRF